MSTLAYKILGMALVLAAVLAGCGREQQQMSEEARTEGVPVVHTMALRTQQAGDWYLTGSLQPRYQSRLAFRVGGQLVDRNIDVGDVVTPGQILMRLDDTDYRLALQIVQADLSATRAEMEQASSELSRLQVLLKKQLVSDQEVERMQNKMDVLNANLQALQLRQTQAERQLAYTVLRASAPGRVTAVSSERGEVVAAGQPVVEIAFDGHREIEVWVPESRVKQLPKQAKGTVLTDAERQSSYALVLRELQEQADPATRSWRARYRLETETAGELENVNRLPLGQTFKVQFGDEVRAYQVPVTALYEQGDFTSVWQVKNGQVFRIPVQVQSLSEQWAWVTAVETDAPAGETSLGSLDEVEQIVRYGVHLLTQGQAVQEWPQ